MIRLARHLLPFAGDRSVCAIQFLCLATMLSAANVVLGTIASAVFLAERGPNELPLFYLALAALSIPLASALSTVIDRWSRVRIFQGLMLGLAAVAVALWLLGSLRLPAVPYAIYLTSHILDIAGQLVFWLLVSEYFTTLDLKRSTTTLAMGLALGGVLGGGAAMLLAEAINVSDLLLVLPPLCVAMIGQVIWLDRSLEPIGGGPSGGEDGLLDSLRSLPVLMLRYRFALLTSASVLLATVLYCFQEYLVFTVYAAAFPEADELARFLAALYAGLQLVEVILLYAVSRPLIAHSGPVLRNAIFPLSTLASLGWLGLTFQLPAAVLSHTNSDAVYNAIYEPVRTLNFVALPLRILGRVRTVADGMIYPAGIALGGLLLLMLQVHLTLQGIAIAALLCALALLAVSIAIGQSFLPTLVRNLRAGAISVADVVAGIRALPASVATDVRHMLASEDAEERALGLALARRLDPGAVLDSVCALARGADTETRRAIAAVLVRLPAAGASPVIDRLLASDDCAQQVLALQVAMAGCLRIDPSRLLALCSSEAVPVALLARLITGGATGEVVAGTDDLAIGEILIETVALAAESPLARLVVPVVRDGPSALRARGLAALAALPGAPDGSVTALAEDLSADVDPAVRAAALRLLARVRGPGCLERFVSALDDFDRGVRRTAAEALSMLNDRQALDALRAAAIDAPEPRWEAIVWALEGMQSRPAQRLLRALLTPTLECAAENAALLRQLPVARDPAVWRPLDVALADSNQRLIECVLKVLAALPRDRVVVQLRRALVSTDLRTRADAIEALASLPDRGLIAAALPLVEAVWLKDFKSGNVSSFPERDPAGLLVLERAEHSWDVWIRRGAASVRCVSARGLKAMQAHALAIGHATEVDMEQLLFLKRIPLFGSLPLDTLLALSHVLAPESYLAGETVFADGSAGRCLYLIRSGMLDVRKNQRLLTRLGPGTYVGEMALIDDAPRSASVVAMEDCTLLRLDRAAFEDLTETYPAMLRELCRMLAFNLREANRNLV